MHPHIPSDGFAGIEDFFVSRRKKFIEHFYADKSIAFRSPVIGKFKTVKYTLTDGDKELIVYEKYQLEIVDELDELLEESDEIPSRVTIFGNNSGKLFYLTAFGLESKPTKAWLNRFDIKPYK